MWWYVALPDIIMSKYRSIFGLIQNHNIVTALMYYKKYVRRCWITSSNIGRDKSFVDDLNKEQGIVRMRVAFVPRSAEIQPSFWRFVFLSILSFFFFSTTTIYFPVLFFTGQYICISFFFSIFYSLGYNWVLLFLFLFFFIFYSLGYIIMYIYFIDLEKKYIESNIYTHFDLEKIWYHLSIYRILT